MEKNLDKVENRNQKICLSYSNKLNTNFNIYVVVYLYFIIVATLITFIMMFSKLIIIFYILIIITIVFGITVIAISIKKRKIIKQTLWKNGLKTEGFIVDVGTILYRSTRRGRILF